MLSLDVPSLRRAMQESFDERTLAKGHGYQCQRRVVNCAVIPEDETWQVRAKVRGSEPSPYQVEIKIGAAKSGYHIRGVCSCPVGLECKHVTATLFEVATEPQRFLVTNGEGVVPAAGSLPEMLPAPVNRPEPVLNPQWKNWLQQIAKFVAPTVPEQQSALPENDEQERLLYVLRPQNGRLKVELVMARRLKSGGFGPTRHLHTSLLLYQSKHVPCLTAQDRRLVCQLMLAQTNFTAFEQFLEGSEGAEVLREMVATGRCHWLSSSTQNSALALGAPRPARPIWRVDTNGAQQPGLQIEPPATELITGLTPPWYVDEGTSVCGPLESGLSPQLTRMWLSAPSVAPLESADLAEVLAQQNAPLPLPQKIEIVELPRTAPGPRLRLFSAELRRRSRPYSWGIGQRAGAFTHFARLEFDYDGRRFEHANGAATMEWFADGQLRRLHRQTNAEQGFAERIRAAGLKPAREVLLDLHPDKHNADFTGPDSNWLHFMTVTLPALRADGWQIEIEDTFQLRLATPEAWYTDAAPENGSSDWFGVELGVILEGERLNLLPILLRLLQTEPHLLQSEELGAMDDSAVIPVLLPDGRKLPFPAGRARQMLGALLELLTPNSLNASGKLRLPRLRAVEMAGEAEWRWMGTSELAELCARLKNFSGIKAVEPPPNLQATLRPYQRDGLNWLQFLREYEIAGVLADDMGLGKTVQTLAHLLVEKAGGRMDRPSLIVAPTSLMTNWQQEAERFAPDLRVLVLHGLDRRQDFARIPEHDLVITSYPLLPRDQTVLREHQFHYLILDEAQFIKNPKTIYAQVTCALQARHHLCLTGTPMENHLGELWSLFNFLLPGFLGDEMRFNTIFRRPIEKGKSDDRRKVLAKRVAPFVLRRKKEEVVKELPPKTEIVQNVELQGAQRDLYESVRLAMHARVKDEVDKKGISRSHIVILDALLKLRQICCHPQLLSLPSARWVRESAKLELLLDLLPQMIAEGRRVLLFSQFTSMLALIELELARVGIPYVVLTGDTRDRATPVQKFQNGEVPLFLISLKAGGTGLNLTAADAVIHYDPWWNPAVESQATDRAHRIGQEKPVFVYKLMTMGTVEQKILSMQARKRELVEGLLNEERRENLKITAEDLEVLFSPLQ